MSRNKWGGPAFPAHENWRIDSGISLRDYFAARAPVDAEIGANNAEKLLGRAPPNDPIQNIMYWDEVQARRSYMWADAMLAVRASV